MSSERQLKYAKEYRQTHKKQIAEWQSKYSRTRRKDPLHREKVLEGRRRSNKKAYDEGKEYAVKRKRDPFKNKAQQLIRNMIYEGKFSRGNCCICYAPNADAHHEDYSKPNEIFWLCRLHHKRRHLGEITLNQKDMIYAKRITKKRNE